MDSLLKVSFGIKQRVTSRIANFLLQHVFFANRPSLSSWQSEEAAFRRRLQERWETPLKHLETYIITCFFIGKEIHDDWVEEELFLNDGHYQEEVLTRLHSRSTRVSREILTLLRNGYADAALARWRSLYEIALVAKFVEKHGEPVAEKFVHYKPIQDLDEAEAYRKYQEEAGLSPMTDEKLEKLEQRRDELRNDFGNSIDDSGRGWGWAAGEFNGSASTRQIAEDVGLDWLLPYYKWASNPVHGGPKSSLYNLGMIDDAENELGRVSAGPTNYGFTDPAQLTMISLLDTTVSLAAMKPKRRQSVALSVLEESGHRIAREFAKVTRDIEYTERYQQEQQ